MGELNAAAREGRYAEALWKERTGRTLPELGTEWRDAQAGRIRDREAARHLHHAYRDDWKVARHAIHEKSVREKKWNQNSTPANGALVLLALLYGEGDFHRTLQYAMALGYDADCNAATAGAVLGARLGFRHLAGLPQFRMPDRHVNQTRPSLPAECPVSSQAATLLRVCERLILAFTLPRQAVSLVVLRRESTPE